MAVRCGEQIGPVYSGSGGVTVRRWSEYTGGAVSDHRRYQSMDYSLGTFPLLVPEDYSDFDPLPGLFYYDRHQVVVVMWLERSKTGVARWYDEAPFAGDDTLAMGSEGFRVTRRHAALLTQQTWANKVWSPHAGGDPTPPGGWNDIILVPYPKKTSLGGDSTETTDDGTMIVSGLDATDPAGAGDVNGYFGSLTGYLPDRLEMPDSGPGLGIPHNGPWGDATWTITAHMAIYTWAEVWHPYEYIEWPPKSEASPYGLAMDLTPLGAIRQVYNVGFNSPSLRLRSCDVPGTWTEKALPFTGRCPEIIVLPNGRLWVTREAGGNVYASRSDDDGETWT